MNKTESPSTPRRQRFRIDPIRCTAFGFCAEFAPEFFSLDEWGYAWQLQPDVPPEQLALLRQTARLCPKAAIRLLESGEAAGAPKR